MVKPSEKGRKSQTFFIRPDELVTKLYGTKKREENGEEIKYFKIKQRKSLYTA